MSAESDIYKNFDYEIATLLASIAEEHGFKFYCFKKSSGSIKGDGYLGVITAVEISSVSDSAQKILNIVIKSAIKGETVRKTMPIAEVFKREIYMYSTVIPNLQRFLTEKGLPLFQSFAKCYKVTALINREALILENLRTSGFKLWERRIPMNEEHVNLVMKEYGRFHALSFALKDQNSAQFKNLTEDMDDLLQKFFDQTDFTSSWNNEFHKVAELFNTYEDGKIRKKFIRFINDIPRFIKKIGNYDKDHAVILHGDCWTDNMMFKYDDVNNTNNPTQVCFLDLQLARVASPILDIAYFFYVCSSKNILDNFQQYLDLYYTSLTGYLKQLGSDSEKVYPHSVFLQQLKELAKYGLLMSVTLIKIMLSEKDEVIDIADCAESGKSVSEMFSYSISNTNEYNERIKHLILHFVKNDFL